MTVTVTPVCGRAGAFDAFFGVRAEIFYVFVATFPSRELILAFFANNDVKLHYFCYVITLQGSVHTYMR